jgi:hypothetical protein
MGSSNRRHSTTQHSVSSGELPKWPGKDELDRLDKQYWTIIGNGSIGAKAEELRKKTWPSIAAGFVMHHRFVLAMEWMKAFRSRNFHHEDLFKELNSYQISEMIKKFEFSPEEIEVARKILRALPKTPLVIRSSAHGDCLGTGIYHSEFIANSHSEERNLKELLQAIRNVLASEFSANGIAFRKNMGIPDGMAVIIEPVFGVKNRSRPEHEFGDGKDECEEFFAPFYGGVGYTSTAYSGPLAGVSAGIPIEAMKFGGITIKEGDDTTLAELFTDPGAIHKFLGKDERATCIASKRVFENLTRPQGINLENGHITDIYSPDVFPKFEQERLDWLFSRIRRLEQLIGRPQRIEWAAIEEQPERRTFFNMFEGVPELKDFFRKNQKEKESKPIVGMLQIGEIDNKREFYHFSDSKRTIMRSRYVQGTDIRECYGLVWIYNSLELGLLEKYNRENKGYIVVFPEKMTKDLSNRSFESLSFHHLSNSSLVAEVFDSTELLHRHHVKTPMSHFGGSLAANNILFMVIPDIDLEKIWERRKVIRGNDPLGELWVFEGKFRVTMSDAQQRAVVEVID